MLSLAALRYRAVFASDGGPVREAEAGVFPLRGRQVFQVNVRLVPGLTPGRAPRLYGDADGTGTHAVLSVARHIAISEALERWAFHAVARSGRSAEFGFDQDPSSNGMAAFPGLFRRSARRRAVLEAVERHSLIGWWEGLVAGELVETDWPGVSAVAIPGPFGGVTVVVFARSGSGRFVYGHAAGESLGAAVERALVELARHEWVLRSHQLGSLSGDGAELTDRFERRCWFFSTPAGHALFQERLRTPPSGRLPRPVVTCDAEIPGPWSRYATVWRYGLQPLTGGYLTAGETYFFW